MRPVQHADWLKRPSTFHLSPGKKTLMTTKRSRTSAECEPEHPTPAGLNSADDPMASDRCTARGMWAVQVRMGKQLAASEGRQPGRNQAAPSETTPINYISQRLFQERTHPISGTMRPLRSCWLLRCAFSVPGERGAKGALRARFPGCTKSVTKQGELNLTCFGTKIGSVNTDAEPVCTV